MAQKAKAYAVSALRALTYRISSTQTGQLPRCVAQLAASIWLCRDILSTPSDALKQDAELSLVVHRFKTQLATLLQDRTVEGRWSAIVLVKATIEAGGVEILSKSNAWVRNILGFLKKPDPSSTRCLAVLTLTRVFMLTWDYSNLVREITTPALPTFISTCLSNADNARCSKEELQGILEAFEILISHHPTIFRSNESALHSLLTRIISSSASTDGPCYAPEHILTAQRVLVLLSFCAPKQGGADKWDESLQNTVKAAHQTCDIIFSPVVEAWKSNIDALRDHATTKHDATQLEQTPVDIAGLKGWTRSFDGAERLNTLLDQIKAHLETASPAPISLRVGMVLDLTMRLFLVTVPGSKRGSLQPNPQMASTTRDSLFATLPVIHEHTFKLLETMVQRLGPVMLPALPVMLEGITAVFAAESFNVELRRATYSLVRAIVHQSGPALTKDEVLELVGVMTACCNDLLPSLTQNSDIAEKLKNPLTSDLALQMDKKDASSQGVLSSSHHQALELLPVLLSRLDATSVPRRIRTQMDRTAVLTKHKNALLASVLNPPPSPSGHGLQNSLLPLLARLYPDDSDIEALIRPRMPFVLAGVRRQDEIGEMPEGEDDFMVENEELPEDEAVAASDLGASYTTNTRLDGLLPSGTVSDSIVTASKHALDDTNDNAAVKRARQDTASSQIQSEWQTALAEESQKPSDSAAAVKALPQLSQSTADVGTMGTGNESEDGSDFEMPPLTMDQDTEDESE